jgi:hypothetical protein
MHRRVAIMLHHRVASSRLGRICDVRIVVRLTSRLFEMSSTDVTTVLDALDAAGVEHWLAGGWGVDALLGRQTRRHTDLDVLVPDDPAQVEVARRALCGLHFREVALRPPSVLMPRRIMFANNSGGAVDVLPIDRRRPPFDDDGSHDPAFVLGTIDRRVVNCLGANVQLQLHEGFPPPAGARADVAALQRLHRSSSLSSQRRRMSSRTRRTVSSGIPAARRTKRSARSPLARRTRLNFNALRPSRYTVTVLRHRKSLMRAAHAHLHGIAPASSRPEVQRSPTECRPILTPRSAPVAHSAAPLSDGGRRRQRWAGSHPLLIARRSLAGQPSALVVPVPAADEVIAAHRLRHDPAAALGMPAHVTVLFPFLPSRLLGPAVEVALQEVLDRFAAFPFQLVDTARFADVLYLAPKPSDRFIELTEALRDRWPAYEPYGGEHAAVVPHLSVAHDSWPDGLEGELARVLPIDAEATEVCLLTQARSGRWSVRLRMELTGASGSEGDGG